MNTFSKISIKKDNLMHVPSALKKNYKSRGLPRGGILTVG